MIDGTGTNPFEAAIWKAFQELESIKQQQEQLVFRKMRLKSTIDALWPIVYPADGDSSVASMSLADAIRTVIRSSDRAMTPKEIRYKLGEIGFDLSKYTNALASIWTAAKRMVDAEELVFVPDEDEKKLAAGPELKTVPEATDAVSEMEKMAEQKK